MYKHSSNSKRHDSDLTSRTTERTTYNNVGESFVNRRDVCGRFARRRETGFKAHRASSPEEQPRGGGRRGRTKSLDPRLDLTIKRDLLERASQKNTFTESHRKSRRWTLLYRMQNRSRRDTSKRLAEGQGGVDKCPPSREPRHLTRPFRSFLPSFVPFAGAGITEEENSVRARIGKCRFSRGDRESTPTTMHYAMRTRVPPLPPSLPMQTPRRAFEHSPTPSTSPRGRENSGDNGS